ncbi:hypothetical protein NDU88_006839 [Pleurodeles waltl]|uniref:Uncharacterized protein n=1 Tax=Pleurodeles waltl TaxID=8319 RepID=A0AAV7MDE0_PLEWA|nr:hypothetical protein NDU88_006839 [Pleurodeles waltl]
MPGHWPGEQYAWITSSLVNGVPLEEEEVVVPTALNAALVEASVMVFVEDWSLHWRTRLPKKRRHWHKHMKENSGPGPKGTPDGFKALVQMANFMLRNAAGCLPGIGNCGKEGAGVRADCGTDIELVGVRSEGSSLNNSGSEDADPVGVQGNLDNLPRPCLLGYRCFFFFVPEE